VIKTILLSLKELGVKVRRLKELFGIPKSSLYEMLKNKESKDNFLIERIQKIAYEFPFYGYRRIHIVLNREGFNINKKKVYRIYKMLNLERENKKKKTFIHSSTTSSITSSPNQRNKIWAMDFIPDSLSIGKGIRILIMMDIFIRKIVGYRVDRSIIGDGVAELLQTSIEGQGKPEVIRRDNRHEFISKVFNRFLFKERIKYEFIEKGKPYENRYIESFMDKLRNECLNLYLFRNIYEARMIIKEYIEYYNNERLHSTIGYETPIDFDKNLSTIKL